MIVAHIAPVVAIAAGSTALIKAVAAAMTVVCALIIVLVTRTDA